MNIPDNYRRSLLAVLAAVLFNLLFPLPQSPFSFGAQVMFAEVAR
jgi:hypothetical protein